MSTTSLKSSENVQILKEALQKIMRGERVPERFDKAFQEARRGREEMLQRIGGVLDVFVALVRESSD